MSQILILIWTLLVSNTSFQRLCFKLHSLAFPLKKVFMTFMDGKSFISTQTASSSTPSIFWNTILNNMALEDPLHITFFIGTLQKNAHTASEICDNCHRSRYCSAIFRYCQHRIIPATWNKSVYTIGQTPLSCARHFRWCALIGCDRWNRSFSLGSFNYVFLESCFKIYLEPRICTIPARCLGKEYTK